MVAVALAALAALSYGAADFSGALAAKRLNATLVTVAMQAVSLAGLLLALSLFPVEQFVAADLAWGAVAGLGAAAALVLFYQALARGPMSVAAALTALWSTALPVVVGLGLGDRPALFTLVGVALAIPSGALVSLDGSGSAQMGRLAPRDQMGAWRQRARTRSLAVAAGAGFALFFIALSRTSGDSGLLPLLGSRLASVTALAIVLTRSRQWAPVPRRWWAPVAAAGILDFAANVLYLLAVQRGSLAWVAAVTSLYPVSTVLMARAVLDERLARIQVYGMATAAAALGLVGVGATAG